MKTKIILPMLLLFIVTNMLTAQQLKQIDSKEANTMLQKNPKLIVLDVRTAQEFNAGHIKGAVNIDVRQADAFSKIDKLDRNATYIVHCRTFHRSTAAVNHMRDSGFKNVYQMMDGWSGWSQNGLPAEK